ncbi:MAG: vitamin-B12 independent methionine synthase [Candidatus Binatia bacterium]
MLEYDDPRSGSFEPLKEVPGDKIAVLGLVSTKGPNLETQEELVNRIHEASRFLPLEQLAVSPQCGFSTSVLGNRISADHQKQKLRAVVEAAQSVWG